MIFGGLRFAIHPTIVRYDMALGRKDTTMLKELELFGFRSIREMKLQLKPMNVLIGANGAGKSNLVEVFRLLKSIENNSLQFYIGKAGGANSLLHYGTQVTKQMGARFCFEIDNTLNWYGMRLSEAHIDITGISQNLITTGISYFVG
jgi:predicted ATPase